MDILGIDIGGTGIKGAPVDVKTGQLVAERHRIETPRPALPDAVADVVAQVAAHFDWKGPIGCTFPGVVHAGTVKTAANVSKTWIGIEGQPLFSSRTGCPVTLLNDADAAGLAEMEFGAGRDKPGVVLMLTLGTGIGSAVFVDGKLLPNTEFGHLPIRGKPAEKRASEKVRRDKGLSWKKWAGNVDEVLRTIEFFLSPDLFIIGGGVSKKHEKFLKYLNTRAPVVPAQMLNEAGIVGAALAARP
jgi:polyphosphate glucokinase